MNYFIHDERDLSPAYVASCRKFFKDIEQREGIKFAGKFKRKAASVKQLRLTSDKLIRYYKRHRNVD